MIITRIVNLRREGFINNVQVKTYVFRLTLAVNSINMEATRACTYLAYEISGEGRKSTGRKEL